MDISTLAFIGILLGGICVLIALRFLSKRSQDAVPGEKALSSAQSIATLEKGASAIVVGRAVVHGAPLTAPLSGRQCLGWAVTIEEYFVSREKLDTRRNRRVGNWRTILHDQEVTEFKVEDDTGRVLVHPGFPELTLVKDSNWESFPLVDAPDAVVAFLKAHGQRATNVHGENRQLRAREGVLEANERVIIAGLVSSELDTSGAQGAAYRGNATRLAITKPPDETLVISDDFQAIRRHGLRRF